jgi:hypothetical protein
VSGIEREDSQLVFEAEGLLAWRAWSKPHTLEVMKVLLISEEESGRN